VSKAISKAVRISDVFPISAPIVTFISSWSSSWW
jgi:hypothetical protein